MNRLLPANEIEIRRSSIGYTLLFLYILTSYIAQPPIMPSIVCSITLYMLVGFSFLKMASELQRFHIGVYTYWYIAFILFSLMTYFYALDPDVVLESVYILIIVVILTFIFTYYINKTMDLSVILSFFAAAGIVLAVLLFSLGLINYESRLGDELYGNANSFGSAIMLSEICFIWLFLYGTKKFKLFYLTGTAVLFYLLLLSGGRKFIITCLLFVFILFFLKYYKTQKQKLVYYMVVFAVLSAAVGFLMFEYKPLYEIVGYRFEGLINAVTGHGKVDVSTLRRKDMIDFGIAAFRDQPIFGYGLNNFKVLYFMNGGLYVYSHNNFIEILVNYGVLGFMLYYGYYGFVFYKLIRLQDDETGLRDFFLSFLITLLFYDYATVTYYIIGIQLMLAMAGRYIWLINKAKEVRDG